MHPFAFVVRLGEVERPFGSFGLLVGLGIFVACALAVRAAARDRQDVGKTFAALALVVGGCLLGAWLAFALVEWARTGSPAPAWRGGGLVFFGAIPGGLAAMLLADRSLRLPTTRILELSLPGLAVGHALGRLGCLLGGCCYGRPFDGPGAILYTHPFAPAAHPSVPRHASPLYEAGGLALLGLAFALVPARAPGDGRRAAAYLGAYALLRIAVEATRGDAIRGVWLSGLASTSQLLAALALVAAGLLWMRARARG